MNVEYTWKDLKKKKNWVAQNTSNSLEARKIIHNKIKYYADPKAPVPFEILLNMVENAKVSTLSSI